MKTRIVEIMAREAVGAELYKAAATVFQLPFLEELFEFASGTPAALVEFYKGWDEDQNFIGPAILTDQRCDYPTALIVTETSSRLVWVRFNESGEIERVTLEFGKGGSEIAAGQILSAFEGRGNAQICTLDNRVLTVEEWWQEEAEYANA